MPNERKAARPAGGRSKRTAAGAEPAAGAAAARSARRPRGSEARATAAAAAEASGRRAARRGVRDMVEGLELGISAESVSSSGAAVAGLSLEDVVLAMDLAGMSGQVAVVGHTLETMRMPAVSAFMRGMSRRMRRLAVAQLLQAREEAGLATELAAASAAVAAAAEEEAAEGLQELAAAAAAERAAESMAAAGNARGAGEAAGRAASAAEEAEAMAAGGDRRP